MYNIEEENVRNTLDGKCREWKILGPGGFAAAPQAHFVRLGVRDHLPKFDGEPGGPGEVRYFDWNIPIDVKPPELTSATAE